jgi:hypothetical protein
MTKDWTGIEGRFNDAAERLARSNLPLDHDLFEQAKRNVGHDYLDEINEEYDRLLAAKMRRRPRGFWSRIFGD